MNIETGIEEYEERAAQENAPASPESEMQIPEPTVVTELEQAEELLRFVLNLRMYGESETETWKQAERDIENFLRRDHCTQCGMRFSHRACGPTHAMIWNEMQNRTGEARHTPKDYYDSIPGEERGADKLTAAYESEERSGE